MYTNYSSNVLFFFIFASFTVKNNLLQSMNIDIIIAIITNKNGR